MKLKTAVLIGSFVMLAACKDFVPINKNSDSDIGRFQIVKMNEHRAFLIDTTTGETWDFVNIIDSEADYKDQNLDSVWKPVNKFNTYYEYITHARFLWNSAADDRSKKKLKPVTDPSVLEKLNSKQ